jgi:hypothetical protein
MNVEKLLSPECSPSDISDLCSSVISSLSLSKFELSLQSLSDSPLSSSIISRVLLQFCHNLSIVSNHPLRVEFAYLLLRFAQPRFRSDTLSQIQSFYARSLEVNGQYIEAARFLISLPTPEDDPPAVEHFLQIGEDFYLGHDYVTSFSYLSKTHTHFFRLATPKPLVDRYDTLRGKLHLRRASFLDAARAFSMLWRSGQTSEIRSFARRMIAITLVFAPQSPFRTGLFYELMTDEEVKTLDVYPMLDRIRGGRFVDAIARDVFLQTVADVVADEWAVRELEKSSTQHNLAMAQHMFISVKLIRLAQLIGDTPENISVQLGKMIDAGMIEAEIDQPEKLVMFLTKDSEKQEKSIEEFCVAVSEIAARVKDL